MVRRMYVEGRRDLRRPVPTSTSSDYELPERLPAVDFETVISVVLVVWGGRNGR